MNADGWGAGSDSWGEGATRTFRLYGGTHTELTNVQYEVRAVQGFSFNSSTVSALSTPGGGALQGNGLTEAIERPGAIELVDENTIRMSIDMMPAHSSFSFNVTGVLDETTNAMVLHHRLIGDDPNCEPTVPVDPEVPPVDPEVPPVEPQVPPVDEESPAAPASPSGSGAGEAPDELAVTGADISGFVVVFGALLLAVGVALSVRTRRS